MTPSRASISNSRGAQPLATLTQRLVHRAAGRGEFGGGQAEVLADQVGGQAHAVVGGQPVGEAYWTMPSASTPDQAVTDARGTRPCPTCWSGNGKEPAAIICARSEALCR